MTWKTIATTAGSIATVIGLIVTVPSLAWQGYLWLNNEASRQNKFAKHCEVRQAMLASELRNVESGIDMAIALDNENRSRVQQENLNKLMRNREKILNEQRKQC